MSKSPITIDIYRHGYMLDKYKGEQLNSTMGLDILDTRID